VTLFKGKANGLRSGDMPHDPPEPLRARRLVQTPVLAGTLLAGLCTVAATSTQAAAEPAPKVIPAVESCPASTAGLGSNEVSVSFHWQPVHQT
jgi:hypothetical protein